MLLAARRVPPGHPTADVGRSAGRVRIQPLAHHQQTKMRSESRDAVARQAEESSHSRRLELTYMSAEIPRKKSAPRKEPSSHQYSLSSLGVTHCLVITYSVRYPFGPPQSERNRYRTAHSLVNADAVILSADSVNCRGYRTFHSRVNSRWVGGLRRELVHGTTIAAATPCHPHPAEQEYMVKVAGPVHPGSIALQHVARQNIIGDLK